MQDQVAAIRLKDIEIFLEVSRAKSIREVARRLNSTPGQISKSIQQLESRLGTKLYKRSVSGVLPTSHGAEMLEIAQELVSGGEKIESLISGQHKGRFAKVVAIAGASFLSTHLITPVVCRYSQTVSDVTFRFLDLAPDQLVPIALRGGFDAAVHYGDLSWPNTWTSAKLGKTRWILCSRAGHPLSKRPTIKQVLEHRFVIPTYWTNEGLVKGNDQFPIPLSKRKAGFETSTADAAIPILMDTDHLAFLPEILAREFLKDRRLREIKPMELPVVERELYLSVRSDLVSASMFKGLSAQLSKHIAE